MNHLIIFGLPPRWGRGLTNIEDAQNFLILFYENFLFDNHIILDENFFDNLIFFDTKSVQVPPAPTTSVLASVADIPLSPGVLLTPGVLLIGGAILLIGVYVFINRKEESRTT